MLLNELHQGPKQTAYGKNQRLDKKLGDTGSNPVSATVVVTPMPLRPTLASREVGMVVFTMKPLERLSSWRDFLLYGSCWPGSTHLFLLLSSARLSFSTSLIDYRLEDSCLSTSSSERPVISHLKFRSPKCLQIQNLRAYPESTKAKCTPELRGVGGGGDGVTVRRTQAPRENFINFSLGLAHNADTRHHWCCLDLGLIWKDLVTHTEKNTCIHKHFR